MGEIKTDLFPCNLRAAKRKIKDGIEEGTKEKGASYRNIVIPVEEIVKAAEFGEDETLS